MAKNDFSKQTLNEYLNHLAQGPLRDMKAYQRMPDLLDNPRMFTAYPDMVVGIAKDLFTVTDDAPVPMRKTIMRHSKKVGWMNLIKDGIKGVKAI